MSAETDDLRTALGITDDPEQKRAEWLVKQDTEFLRALVAARHSAGLTKEQVAERVGLPVERVADFEAYWADPPLSTIRRYAHAIGYHYSHRVYKTDCECALCVPVGGYE